MAKAKKLPSGQYRALVYSHTENGKRKYESFTAPTKAEAEAKAAQFANAKTRRVRHDLTVGDALSQYIEVKEGVLSPSTIAGYEKMLRNNFDSIMDKKVRSLTSADLQRYISDLASDHSSKTVENAYSFLHAALDMHAPDMTFKVTLPPKRKRRPTSPEDQDIKRLFDAAPHNLKVSIGFAMMGLREGEIVALEYSDLSGDIIHVQRDIVRDKDGQWVTKELPKTSDSDRYVKLPPFLMDMIGTGEGRIVPVRPSTISKEFHKLKKGLGIDIRFHDLRHYFASTAAVLGVPDVYLADMGGWNRGGSVMKSIYQNSMKSMSDYYAGIMTDHMDKIIKEDA